MLVGAGMLAAAIEQPGVQLLEAGEAQPRGGPKATPRRGGNKRSRTSPTWFST